MSDTKQDVVEMLRELAELTVLDEGDPNSFRVRAYETAAQAITAQATDIAGNQATGVVITLSIDKTPPTIVQLSTPDHISRLHGGQVNVTVNDNFMVTQVDQSARHADRVFRAQRDQQRNRLVHGASMPPPRFCPVVFSPAGSL